MVDPSYPTYPAACDHAKSCFISLLVSGCYAVLLPRAIIFVFRSPVPVGIIITSLSKISLDKAERDRDSHNSRFYLYFELMDAFDRVHDIFSGCACS